MKHFMLPKSSSPLSELSTSPNPNPLKSKPSNHHRKQKFPPPDKENSDPSSDSLAGKPSPFGKLKIPLPPRPPPSTNITANPLKRKLSNDAVLDVVVGGGPCPSSADSGVKVVVRMRPLNKDERDGETIVKKVSNDSLTINEHNFTFDSVADMDSTQLDIFQLVGAPLVENCLAGFNSSVFAYGQTGSGKTYTMWGPANALLEDNLVNEQQGLTPRVFERLFSRINEEQIKHADKQLEYQCRCSFLEIYNEQITDLLDPSQKNLQIREDVKSGVYVENLTEECVSTAKDVIRLLLKGLSHRRTGATSINAESSRSHSVFTCAVESQCKSMSNGLSTLKTSKINLVDLAGSERQKLTGAAGERLKEAGNINRSLSQLGNLINILAEISQTGKQRHIPYRDSRLTFLLQESLGGNAKMAMICAISPAQSCKSESFSTLRFAQRAKAIKNKAVVNEVIQEDDVNVLREVIKQLKEELLRMKTNGNQSDPKAAYANSWNARRSLSLLKLSLKHPIVLRHLDADGDEEMEIDEEAVEMLCNEVHEHSNGLELRQCKDGCVEKQSSELSDVSMEEGISDIDDDEVIVDGEVKDTIKIEEKDVDDTPCKLIKDSSAFLSSAPETVDAEATNSPSNGALETSAPRLSVIPCDASPILPSPPESVSPRIVSSSRKSLRTSSMVTASQKDIESFGLGKKDVHASLTKFSQRKSQLAWTIMPGNNARSTTEHLAASLHRGLEIIDNQRKSSAFRKSSFRLSFKPAEMKSILPIEKVDVGIQTLPESIEMPEIHGVVYLCSNCKNKSLLGDAKEANDKNKSPLEDAKQANDPSNLQLVPVDRSLSLEKPKKQVPKAVEKVLAGAIRREMALEDFCAKQTYEIAQLNRLVQQYKHERECNAIISEMREDKIIRLENLMDGVLPTEDFMEEEFMSLRREHELLNEKYENHPEVLETKIELKRAQEELERLQNFFDMGEKDVLLEEIHDLRSQLQYYTDSSPKSSRPRKSLLQLTYPCERSSSQPLNTIPESVEDNAVEQERIKWIEVESQWISLAEELKSELESTRYHAEQVELELEAEKKCSEELKEALQLAMEGQARMLEQHADLEEKHMQMLARRRQVQEGIEDVKKAAARAGVRGVESKFINALAAEISSLKVERERERQYFRDENKMLQSQLRDTAEALQAAGELLVRLKEGEEAVAAAEKRAAAAEEESEKTRKLIDELNKKHKTDINSLNQIIADFRLPKEALQESYHTSSVAKFDGEERHSAGDERWKEEFQAFYKDGIDDELSSNFAEPSSWFSGYDRCNI